MKTYYRILFVAIFLYFNQSNAQEPTKVNSFKLTEETPFLINQFVVIEKDSMSVQEGYKTVLEWINIVYNTPKEVIKAQLENDYVRIEGSKSNSPCIKSLGIPSCWDTKYSLTFEFKENKVKLQLTRLQIYTSPNQYTSGGWGEAIPHFKSLTKKNGKPAKTMVQMYEGFETTIEDLHRDFEVYLKNPIKEQTAKSDW